MRQPRTPIPGTKASAGPPENQQEGAASPQACTGRRRARSRAGRPHAMTLPTRGAAYFETSSRGPRLRIKDFEEPARVRRTFSQARHGDDDVCVALIKSFTVRYELRITSHYRVFSGFTPLLREGLAPQHRFGIGNVSRDQHLFFAG